ncbi:aldehyde dehydrogenase [Vagococcus jeotgali]|uniref:aldehyde dehydrogenase n=1 Tax=Vagococcus jeotgali TaxID=3109030 RepID=UPI002DD87778|nr:aldehyde dehydrogenase [Vagococcus sp. B2T-5]
MTTLTKQDIQTLLTSQHNFFNTNQTKSYDFRMTQLDLLKQGIIRFEPQLLTALEQDLGKSATEAFVTEIGIVLSSISHVMKNLHKWMTPEVVKTELFMQPGKSIIYKEPLGSVLIIGPFNYPIQTTLEPLIGAIAAGNCAVIKPSELTPNVSQVLKEMLASLFPDFYISVILGEVRETTLLLDEAFDFIFFTGSPTVGKIVMTAASKHLTPVCLELGGKSPVIVDKTANIPLTAQRIVWGKFLNTGQTCVAPDYCLVDSKVKDELIAEMIHVIENFYGKHAVNSPDYGHIVNSKQFDRLNTLLNDNEDKIIFGGKVDRDKLFIAPTMMDHVSLDDTVMSEEIFGPILPIIEINNLDDAIDIIKDGEKPLALYLFTKSKENETRVIHEVSFGSGAINATVLQVSSRFLPFGGVGQSGMGHYHGKYSFDLFSHSKSILKKYPFKDLTCIVNPPFKNKLKLFKRYFK